MDIQAQKNQLIEWITQLNDSSLIKELRSIMSEYSEKEDWSDSLSEEALESINRGLKDIDEGRTHSHDSVRKLYEKHL